MSEVYVLVKQVEDRPSGEATLHGVTENEDVRATWESGSEENYAVLFDLNETPSSEKWTLDEESA